MKRATVNQQANIEMKKQCEELHIFNCEACKGLKCHNWFLTFAHRHKRRWYYDKPISWLWKRSQWRLLGVKCHEEIEYNKELTEKLFEGEKDDE